MSVVPTQVMAERAALDTEQLFAAITGVEKRLAPGQPAHPTGARHGEPTPASEAGHRSVEWWEASKHWSYSHALEPTTWGSELPQSSQNLSRTNPLSRSGYLYNVSPGALFPEEHAVSSARLSERYVAPCGGLALRLIARHRPAYRAARMARNRAGVQPFSLRLPKTGSAPAEAVKFRLAGISPTRHRLEEDPVMKTIFTAASLALLMALPVAAQDAATPSGHRALRSSRSVEKQTAVSFSGDVSAKELLDAASSMPQTRSWVTSTTS